MNVDTTTSGAPAKKSSVVWLHYPMLTHAQVYASCVEARVSVSVTVELRHGRRRSDESPASCVTGGEDVVARGCDGTLALEATSRGVRSCSWRCRWRCDAAARKRRCDADNDGRWCESAATTAAREATTRLWWCDVVPSTTNRTRWHWRLSPCMLKRRSNQD